MATVEHPVRWRPGRTESLVALGALVLGQLEVWGFWVPAEQGPRGLAAVAMATQALALLWCARAPVTAAGAIGAIQLLWVAVHPPHGPLVPLLIALVAIFAVAAQRPAGIAAIASAWVVAGGFADITATSPDFANYAFVGAFEIGAFAAGRGVRRGFGRADEMEARAVRAEEEREARARAAVLEERARLARELHDIVAHSVGVMVIQAQAAQQLASEPHVTRGLEGIETTGQQALGELRRLLGLLRRNGDAAALGPQPGLRHVHDLVATVRDAGLPVTLSVEGDPEPLPPGVDLSAYRIVQEALTNALKHAGRTSARVTLRYGPGDLEIEVTDDGAGATPGPDDGYGLAGMRERVSVYGGSLVAGSRPEGGYALRARLPLERAAS